MVIIKLLFAKIFVFVLLGFLLSLIKGLNIRKPAQFFIDLVLYGLFPVFVLFSVWTTRIEYGALGRIALLAFGVAAVGALLAYIFAKASGRAYRDYCLPVIFANSAYLGIPVNTYLLGSAATVYAIIYDLTPTLLMFTIGILLVAKENKLREALRMPMVYAALLGLYLNYRHAMVNEQVGFWVQQLKGLTIPLLLLIVGYQLKPLRWATFSSALAGSLLRMGGGLAVAMVIGRLLALPDLVQGVCVISASMPAAVNSYVLAQKYQADAEFAAATLALSTLLSIPFILFVALLIR